MCRIVIFLGIFCSILIGSLHFAAAEKRVALVIGNSAYSHAAPLENPKNDAFAISDVLEKLGFEVVSGIDLKHQDFARVISTFRKKLSGADIGLFFYAGHGLQVNGQNYLAPVDAQLNDETSLGFEAVPLHLVLNLMEQSAKTNLVFLDACRDNPLARNLARSMGTRSTAIGRGLAREETGVGTLISFATQPGNVALDGKGKHSPFAAGMLKHIETPGMDVALVMRRVRQDVIKTTSGAQVPWSNSSLTSAFEFKPEAKTVATASVRTPAPESAPSSLPMAAPTRQPAWAEFATVERIGTCGAYEAFEKEYPDSYHATLAHEWRQKNCQANRKLANLQEVASKEKAESPAAPEDPSKLALALQKGLNRVGCNVGSADGDWGPRSRHALSQFNTHAKLALPTDQATAQAFRAVTARTARVCSAPPQQQKQTVRTTPEPAQKKTTSTSVKKKKATAPAKKVTTASGAKVCNDACILRRLCRTGAPYGNECNWAKERVRKGQIICTHGCQSTLGPGEVYRPGVR